MRYLVKLLSSFNKASAFFCISLLFFTLLNKFHFYNNGESSKLFFLIKLVNQVQINSRKIIIKFLGVCVCLWSFICGIRRNRIRFMKDVIQFYGNVYGQTSVLWIHRYYWYRPMFLWFARLIDLDKISQLGRDAYKIIMVSSVKAMSKRHHTACNDFLSTVIIFVPHRCWFTKKFNVLV